MLPTWAILAFSFCNEEKICLCILILKYYYLPLQVHIRGMQLVNIYVRKTPKHVVVIVLFPAKFYFELHFVFVLKLNLQFSATLLSELNIHRYISRYICPSLHGKRETKINM